MEKYQGYYRRGDIVYYPSEAELCACAQACNVDRGMIEFVSPVHPEQQRRFESHLATGSYMETMVFESILKPDRDQKQFLITAFEAVRFENCLLRTRLVKYEERVFQVVLSDRAEWTEGVNPSVYMGQNSVVRMSYGNPLYRYAFLDDEDKPCYFVWTSMSKEVLDMPKLTLSQQQSTTAALNYGKVQSVIIVLKLTVADQDARYDSG